MPKILEDCVKKVQAQIDKGELPKGSSAYAICISQLKKAGKIKKGKGRHWNLAKERANEMERQLKKS